MKVPSPHVLGALVLVIVVLVIAAGGIMLSRGRSAKALYEEGTGKLEKGDWDGAIKAFDEAIRLKPDDLKAYINRGCAKGEKGDLDGEIKDCDEVIRLEPKHQVAYFNRGHAKSEKGDWDGAIKDFDEAIRLEPGDPHAYDNRGHAKCAKGDWAGAIKDYDEAIRLEPDDLEAYTHRGRTKVLLGDKEGGRADLAKAVDIDPQSDAEIWLVGLGGDKDRLGKFDDGKDLISSVVRYYLGRTTREQLLAEARKAAREREVQERLCMAHGYIGLLAEKDGDAQLARASYEACVATGLTGKIMYTWAKARLAAMSKPENKK